MVHNIFYKKSIQKDLRHIDKTIAESLIEEFESKFVHHPNIGESLKGKFKGLFKYKSGDYRIIYTKIPEGILVLRIGHRKEVYR